MKKILFAALTAVVAIGIAVPVALGASKPVPVVPTVANQLTCFDGTIGGAIYGGNCTLTKYGVATLDNETNDVTATTNPCDQYSGVYVKNSNLVGKAIGTINQLGFSYTGDAATGGAPRISLGIDTQRRREVRRRLRLHLRFPLQRRCGERRRHQRPDLHDLHRRQGSTPTGPQWLQLTPSTGSATPRSSSPTSAARGLSPT